MPTHSCSNYLNHPTLIKLAKVLPLFIFFKFLLSKSKTFSNILFNPTHFPGPLVCRIRQVPLYFVTKLVTLNFQRNILYSRYTL